MSKKRNEAPPVAIETERSFLGLILAKNSILDDPRCRLPESVFHLESHRIIYRSAWEHKNSGRVFSPETAADALGDAYPEAAAIVLRIGHNTVAYAQVDRAAGFAETIRDTARDRERFDLRQQQRHELNNGASEEKLAEIDARLFNLGSRHQTPRPPEVDKYIPFPVDALPDPIDRFVAEGAAAIGCDPAFVALPALAALASAIGSTRRLKIKHKWHAPPTLWLACVAESGSQKSPAQRLATDPIHRLQSQEFARYTNRIRDDDSSTDDAPPASDRLIVSDTTVEALAPILNDNARGVLMLRDELSGWLASFNQYKGGKAGSDEAQWLSAYNGEPMLVDRKNGTPKTIYVPHAFISVTGGIQPEVLRRSLGREHCESGLAARFLFAAPPRKPKRWTEAEIDPETEKAYAKTINRLFDLKGTTDPAENPQPVLLEFSPAAKDAWLEFFGRHADELAALEGDLAAAWSKLEEIPARLAIIIHEVKKEEESFITGETMASAIRLTEWFKNEARRLYGSFSESQEDRERRILLDWIVDQGGRVTVRETQRQFRSRFKTSQEAEIALRAFADGGYGSMRIRKSEGRGRQPLEFKLWDTGTVDTNS